MLPESYFNDDEDEVDVEEVIIQCRPGEADHELDGAIVNENILKRFSQQRRYNDGVT